MDKPPMMLELTIDDVNTIMAGLAELPIKVSLATFQKVRQQAEAQLNQPAPPMPNPNDFMES